MTTNIEFALMAGASYISTRPDVNKFPVPVGWIERIGQRKNDPASGFEATYFTKGTEIVISYITKGGCKNFCVNGQQAGNCHIARSDDDRSEESRTQGVAGQPVG